MKRRTLEKYVLPLSLAIGLLLAGGAVLAQDRGPAGGSVTVDQFGTRLQAIDKQLTSIEQLFGRIEAAKLAADKDRHAEELNNSLDAYTKAMLESFDTALGQADTAAKKQGREGSMALLKPFEAHAEKHANRLKKLEDQAQKMASQKSSSISEPAAGGNLARAWPLLEKVSDFFISPTQAAIALTTVAPCSNLNPKSTPPPTAAQYAACAKAILAAHNQRITAQNTYNACVVKANQALTKTGRAARRTLCAIALGVRLA